MYSAMGLRPAEFAGLAFTLALTAGEASAIPKPELWHFWAASDSKGRCSLDHALWQKFLDGYLEAGADGINRVRYLAVSPEDRALLRCYLGGLGAIDPRALNRAEQLAFWINLYNALTVDVVLQHPGKNSILAMGRRRLSIGPWNDRIAAVAGQSLSLHDIEHRILRPLWQDPRLHYAVNCASVGCPNLGRTALTATNTQELLRTAERDYVNHPRAVAFAGNGRLRLSSIFKWYLHDFAPDERALLSYLADRHVELGPALRHYEGRIEFAYDWRLNTAR
jgi:hypothetical protein